MKCFSRAWCTGQLAEATARARLKAYRKHLDTVAARLPATVYALGRGVNIHDGRFRAVKVDRPKRRIGVTLRCGDNRVGYFDLTLRYDSVDFVRTDASALSRIAGDTEREVLYDEIDSTGSGEALRCSHRVVCWPDYREFVVVFRALGMRLEPRASRAFRRRKPRPRYTAQRSNRRLQPTPAASPARDSRRR
jgi:hypothetical protein